MSIQTTDSYDNDLFRHLSDAALEAIEVAEPEDLTDNMIQSINDDLEELMIDDIDFEAHKSSVKLERSGDDVFLTIRARL